MTDTDAYVHVQAAPGETSGVAAAIRDLEAVTAAHVVTGEFDVIARLDLDDPDVETHDWLQTEIDEDGRDGEELAAVESVRAVDGVTSATVNMAFEP
jgi:DNA-binding Lrp family transcriptional regulator